MTKKMLVKYDPANPEKSSSEFLFPNRNSGTIALCSIKNNAPSEFGLVVYTGRDLSSADLFARIIETGHVIKSVEQMMCDLKIFLIEIKNQKIGNVVALDQVAIKGDALRLRSANLRAYK